jgi:hypothetical protein
VGNFRDRHWGFLMIVDSPLFAAEPEIKDFSVLAGTGNGS